MTLHCMCWSVLAYTIILYIMSIAILWLVACWVLVRAFRKVQHSSISRNGGIRLPGGQRWYDKI